jgi:hypothetical protein
MHHMCAGISARRAGTHARTHARTHAQRRTPDFTHCSTLGMHTHWPLERVVEASTSIGHVPQAVRTLWSRNSMHHVCVGISALCAGTRARARTPDFTHCSTLCLHTHWLLGLEACVVGLGHVDQAPAPRKPLRMSAIAWHTHTYRVGLEACRGHWVAKPLTGGREFRVTRCAMRSEGAAQGHPDSDSAGAVASD